MMEVNSEIEKKVGEILRSGKVNYWTGPEGQLLEEEFAQAVGMRFAVAVMNGAAARRVAALVKEVRPRDKVVTYEFGIGRSITAGGAGGMICCNDEKAAWEIRSIRDQGYDVRAKLDLLKREGKSLYVHKRLGYNYRLTEIQSAIARIELKELVRKRGGKALARRGENLI